jgi:hypothetical protein
MWPGVFAKRCVHRAGSKMEMMRPCSSQVMLCLHKAQARGSGVELECRVGPGAQLARWGSVKKEVSTG